MTLLTPPRVPEIAPDERIAPARPTLAVIDRLPGSPVIEHVARGPGVVRARIVVRHKAGYDLNGSTAAAHPDALLDATRALLAALPAHTMLVAEGPALLACLAPRIAILATASASLASLDPDVRALRDRFDLVLYDARAGALDAVVRTLQA